MDWIFILIVITVSLALIFDIINGANDAANSIATIVSTRVLNPKFAVFWAAFFNFIAMFVFVPRVADTISKIVIINPNDPNFMWVVLTGLIGASLFSLISTIYGIPMSVSHSLVGGLAGAGIAYKGMEVIRWSKLSEAALFIPLSPMIGFAIAALIMLAVYWIFRKWHPIKVDKVFRKGQLFSAAMYSLGHGGNDAQKTMGVILAILIAGGYLSPTTKLSLTDMSTLWIILSCHLAMAIGTGIGGWRVVKTLGMKITKLKPVHGFCAETAGATAIFFATVLGIPVSTTHTIAGSIVGVGSVTNIAGIKWSISIRIIAAWIITIPASAAISAICFGIYRLFAHF